MSGKRIICARCHRPQRTCLCHWITPCHNEVELLILQHPLEVTNAKNSASLLNLSLSKSQIVQGETFPPDQLNDLITQDDTYNVLLYPETPDIPSPDLGSQTEVQPAAQRTRLIVLDATWRKSRKMLYLNPPLQQLPRLSLEHCPPSRYLIRKAPKENQLSTLEASCYALAQLEEHRVNYAPLLDAFDGLIAELGAFRPHAR